MDFVVARLDSVPEGAVIDFRYGPTPVVYMGWAVTGLSLAALLLWVVRPRWYGSVLERIRRLAMGSRARLARRSWSEEG
jgi:hypothetical protein